MSLFPVLTHPPDTANQTGTRSPPRSRLAFRSPSQVESATSSPFPEQSRPADSLIPSPVSRSLLRLVRPPSRPPQSSLRSPAKARAPSRPVLARTPEKQAAHLHRCSHFHSPHLLALHPRAA